MNIVRRTTGTGKLHDEVLASLPSAPRFDWHNADAGIVFTDSLLIVYDRYPDSVVRVPLEAIRDVTLRRGWWSTLLSHFLVIRYDIAGQSHYYAKVKMSRPLGEEAVIGIAEATESNTEVHFKIEPIYTPRLVAGLVLMGLFIWVVGSLKFYYQGQGPLIEVVLGTGLISAVIIVVLAMVAYAQ